MSNESFWKSRTKDWELVGPPLKPVPEDIDAIFNLVCIKLKVMTQAVVLGATPQYLSLGERLMTHLTFVDISEDMIKYCWHDALNATAVKANWLNMPLPSDFYQLVLADGSLTVLPNLDQYSMLAKELDRVLSNGGLFVVRAYVPTEQETVDFVFKQLEAGAINNFHAFKWRLAMALSNNDGEVPVSDIWFTWFDRYERSDEVIKSLNWDPAVLRTINAYEDSDVVYTFPTLDKVMSKFSHFKLMGDYRPTYFDGERYPTLCFQK